MIAKIQLSNEEYSYIPSSGMWLKSSSEEVVSNEQALLEVCSFVISSTKASHQSEASMEVYLQDGQKRVAELARKGWPDYYKTEMETWNLRELYMLLADSVENLQSWSRSYDLDRQFLPEAARVYPWLDPDSIDNTLTEAGAESERYEDADHYRSAIPKAKEAASILRQAIERELYNSLLIGEEDRTSRIRRRVEDALRKGHPSRQVVREVLVKAALELEVRLD